MMTVSPTDLRHLRRKNPGRRRFLNQTFGEEHCFYPRDRRNSARRGDEIVMGWGNRATPC